MIVVADTGPLLALAKIDALYLLEDLYGQVFIPPAVQVEAVMAGLAQGVSDAVALEAAYSRGMLQVRTPVSVLPVPSLLHEGERESIRLAIELDADWLLVDDLDARHAAETNFSAIGLTTRIKGTLGVIVSAFQQEQVSRETSIALVESLKSRPDIWIASVLCDRVVAVLQTSPDL